MPDPLETAASPSNTRRVVIEPVSRVEGHGKVTLLLDAENRVQQARLHIVEFRGFERFIQGRPFWEVPVMVQRLCGICPISHHLAAGKAMDRVVGVRQLPPTAEKIRRVVHLAQTLQSHALHFFYLASPDLLLGFDADVDRRNIVGIAAAYPEVARRGIALRAWGQDVLQRLTGKRIHGVLVVPGGVNQRVKPEDRDALRGSVDEVVGWCRDAVSLVRDLYQHDLERNARFAAFRSSFLSLIRADGALDLYDGGLRVRDADGGAILDHVPTDSYRDHIHETVKPWTYLKFPYLVAQGEEQGWYRVGPLARLANADRVPTPLAEEERRVFFADGAPVHASLASHWARMIEMLHAAEGIRELLDDPELMGDELLGHGERQRSGVGILEAPRGTLIHHYEVGDDDLVTRCNLIVSTTHNNQAMNTAVREVARHEFDGRAVTEGLLNHIEVAIRAFDPCLSCATHALGKMPLIVECVDPSGAVVATATRDGDGGFAAS